MDKKHLIKSKNGRQIYLNLTKRYIEIWENERLERVIMSTKAAEDFLNNGIIITH